jgi:Super-infection exclusion protein B
MDWLSKLKDALSLDPRQLTMVAVGAWVLLVMPQAVIDVLGIAALRISYLPWIGLVALLSTVILAVNLAFDLTQQRVQKRQDQRTRQQQLDDLRKLTTKEKRTLGFYVYYQQIQAHSLDRGSFDASY